MNSLSGFVVPSVASSLAFLAIVGGNCAAWIVALRRAWPGKPTSMRLGALALAAVLGSSGYFASSGLLAETAGSPRAIIYFAVSNVLALGLVFSPVGDRFARSLPVVWLVGIQSFRLPLELVLHSWFEQGTVPVQMTYIGDNWDILTGTMALILAGSLPRMSERAQYIAALLFNSVGLVLLLRVMSIAMRSVPSPLRTYLNEPALLLAFYVPFTWIVPMCVGTALFVHGVSLRWLWNHRGSLRNSGVLPPTQHAQ